MSGKKKYRINITEKNFGHVIVEADSEEEALEAAEQVYSDGEVIWGKTDFQVGEIEEE